MTLPGILAALVLLVVIGALELAYVLSQSRRVKRLDASGILTLEAHVRRTSGPEQTGPEGHGGGHRVRSDDRESIPQLVKRLSRSWTFCGWPSVNHANRRPEQSSHRNALSPTSRVSPGQRAASRCCNRHTSRSHRHAQRERQADDQTKQGQGLVVGRAVGPARGMPKGMAEVCP